MSGMKRKYNAGEYGRKRAKVTMKAVAIMKAPRNRYPRIKGAIQPWWQKELKFVDTVLQSNTHLYDTTGLATPVNLIAVGDDNTTRDGRQVTIKSVQIHGRIDPVDATTAACLCRTMLVWDNANNGVATTSANLIAAVLTSANASAFPLVNNQNRFTILWDSYKALGFFDQTTATLAVADRTVQTVNYYRRLNNITQYVLTTAVIEAIQTGALWFITIGDAAPNVGGRFNGQVRVRYVDQ